MKKHLRFKTTAFALSALLSILSASPIFAQSNKSNTPADARNVKVGAFMVQVPTDWKDFNASEC